MAQRALEDEWEAAVDEGLLELAKAVENGSPSPPMKLFTASFHLTGAPVPSGVWAEAYESALTQASLEARSPRRPDKERVKEEVRAEIERRMPTVRAATEPSGLCFVDPHVAVFSDGTTYRLPVMRVPIDAIDGWTIGDEQVISKPGGGFFVGGGVSLPLGD